ncbi:N-methyltryptophan oxidase [Chlorella sorokiniana]|uniref:N-methyltryptophan oxidase n=1 Tax=Chlorella sorokiniana TaxID=3076 RepID=A0A2P6TUN2_CHLSO|nr:N-methyltryptophan oxidase [Chlorella sorokiniana]|eukprot:PRW57777.1 N-methyltryptophan oxidase [Chlorella sorokiniana]
MQGMPATTPQPGPPLPAAAAATSSRRAADVAVVGISLQAYATAYLLAKRGKRTVLVEHAAPQLAGVLPPARPDVALHLPAASPHAVSAATEAFALWRGIEASAEGARGLLHLCGSIDIAPVRGSSAASDALGAMQDASRAAGLQFGMLSPDEVSAAFPRLRPPKGSAALYTNAGGVVNGQLAAAVLRAMAQRAGAVLAPACLLGWRDAGGHLALRTAPLDAAAAAGAAGAGLGSEGEVVYECEQLVLLPESAVQQQSLALFGLSVQQAQLWRLPASQVGKCGMNCPSLIVS